MSRIVNLYRTSVGKKIVMAFTGALMFLFVVGHMLGNLKIFLGREKFDHYAEWLREMGDPLFAHGQALWIVRIVLLAAVGLHIVAAAQLTWMSWQARDTKYTRQERIAFSYASYTMRWGGVVVAFYVLYHLMHLTWGTVHGQFIPSKAYHNVVSGFQVWWVSLVYMLAVAVLGLHLYHGIWSAFQTLGINQPRYNAWRRPFAAIVAVVIVLGYLSVPISVMTGVLKP